MMCRIRILDNILHPLQNVEEVAIEICNMKNLNIGRKSLCDKLIMHPDYPSLLSISDVFSSYGINNLSLYYSKDNERDIMNIELPLIAQVYSKKSNTLLFSIIQSICDNKVTWYNPESHTWDTISWDYFISIFTGYIQVYNFENIHMSEYENIEYEKERMSIYREYLFLLFFPVISLCVSVFSLLNHSADSLFTAIFIFLLVLGASFSFLLMIYDIDKINPFLKRICTISKVTDCSAVLYSSASKIWGIPWSVIGFSYFMSLLMMILIGLFFNTSVLSLISFLSVIAFPYIFYSLYYQIVIKQWCTMCLAVQLVIFFLFFVSLFSGYLSLVSIKVVLWPFFLIFSSILIVSYSFLLIVKKANSCQNDLYSISRFKFDLQVFKFLLDSQDNKINAVDNMGIVLGNPNGKISIIKICNPYCVACINAHKKLDYLLDNNGDIKVSIIFHVNIQEENDRLFIVRHLLYLASYNNDLIRQLLDEWYLVGNQDYKLFAQKYPAQENVLKEQDVKILAMQKLCENISLKYTPTFYINGSILPSIYTIDDLVVMFSR